MTPREPAMTHRQERRLRHRGLAVMLVMIAVAAATVLCLGFLATQSISAQLSGNVGNAAHARQVAESLLQTAGVYIQSTSNWRTAESPGYWTQNQPFMNGTVSLYAQDGWDSNGDGVISVPAEGNSNFSDTSHAVTLKATVTYKGATMVARSVMTPRPETLTSGILASGQVAIKGGSCLIDSYNSGLGPYGGTNVGSMATVTTDSTAAGAVKVEASSVIKGSVSVGTGGNTTTAIDSSGGTITGDKTALSSPYPLPTLTAPTGMGVVIGDLTFSGDNTTVLGMNLHVNNLTMQSKAKIRIQGNVTILAEGLVSMQNNGTSIEVLPGSSLKLYFKNGLQIKSGATSFVDGPALSRLQFLNLGTSPVVLDAVGTSANCVIVSPNAPVQMSSNAELFGAVIAQSLEMTSGAKVHQDTAITNGSDKVTYPNWVGGTYAVRWLAR
jgi:Tfp pilus assembly protein PilX